MSPPRSTSPTGALLACALVGAVDPAAEASAFAGAGPQRAGADLRAMAPGAGAVGPGFVEGQAFEQHPRVSPGRQVGTEGAARLSRVAFDSATSTPELRQ